MCEKKSEKEIKGIMMYDSQAALKSLYLIEIKSKVFMHCVTSLNEPGIHNKTVGYLVMKDSRINSQP